MVVVAAREAAASTTAALLSGSTLDSAVAWRAFVMLALHFSGRAFTVLAEAINS
jgi:hypothetical protein